MSHLDEKAVLDACDVGLIAAELDGRIAHANARAREVLGRGATDLRGAALSSLLPEAATWAEQCVSTGEPSGERRTSEGGQPLWVSVSPLRIRRRIAGTVLRLRPAPGVEPAAPCPPSAQELQTVFDTSHDGLWIVDAGGIVRNLNRAAEELNQVKAAELIGRSVHELVDQGVFDSSVSEKVLETGTQQSLMQYARRSGKHLLVTGTPAFDTEGRLAFVVTNDRDHTELMSLTSQLEQARLVNEKFREELAELNLVEAARREIVAESEEMRQVLRVSLKMARLDVSNILLLGESGTGKGLLAKFIHKNSRRSDKPFIHINCAALPENLLEAELFGYERGAFTGAREHGKAGLLELANEGTLFLDEIGEIPPSVQAKLLKYLDDHELLPLGATKPRSVDCTVVAATNADLEASVKKKQFRHDLFYRLNAFTVRLPALRERRGDILVLATHFVRKYNDIYRTNKRLTSRAMRWLQGHAFPGNVRELEGLIKNAIVMTEGDLLDDFDGPSPVERAAPGGQEGLKDLPSELLAHERGILRDALERCRTTRDLAAYLGLSQPTVVRKLRRHRLSTAG